MKKFLAICLSLCLAVALFAVPAFAEGEASVTTADELKTELANGGKLFWQVMSILMKLCR